MTTKNRSPKQKMNEMAALRAKAFIAFDEMTTLRHEAAIIKKAIDSAGGVEWYLHMITDKIAELSTQHAEIRKTIDGLVDYDES